MILTQIQDFNYAGLRADTNEIVSTQMYLPMPGHGSTTADFFHPLCRHIEDAVITGKVPYPAERTLLTSGMTLAGVESLHRGQVPIKTPQMDVRYTVGELRDCTGACHVYTDSTMTTIKENRPGPEHRISAGEF